MRNTEELEIKCGMNMFAKACSDRLAMETGDLSFYKHKLIKHTSRKDVDRVMLYLLIYYSFHDVGAHDAREKFPEAISFLASQGIRGKIIKGKEGTTGEAKYNQMYFVDSAKTPLTDMTHYPNGYDHYFKDEF